MRTKGIRVITELAEKDVTFLTDADIEFVSLVKHAANQQPFRVIKEEKPQEEVEVESIFKETVSKYGTSEGARLAWEHMRGRRAEGESSTPSMTPSSRFVKKNVFKNYVEKRDWGGHSEGWLRVNRQVGSLEARIGHLRVKAGSASDEQKEILLGIATKLKRELDLAVVKRNRIGKAAKAEEDGEISDEEMTELEEINLGPLMRLLIEELSEEMDIDEDEIIDALGEYAT